MEHINPIKFVVGEEYKNEKGLFEVLSVKGDKMDIRWENGEEMTCDVRIQRRIQERRRWEKKRRAQMAEAKNKSKGAAREARPFTGLAPEDFKDKISRTPWRSRQQLGGAVTRLLRPSRPRINSWAGKRRNAVHWADAGHWKARQGGCHLKLSARADAATFLWGLSFERALPGATGSSIEWRAFEQWLAQENNEQRLQATALESGLNLFDVSQPASLELLKVVDKGWVAVEGKKERAFESFGDAVAALPDAVSKEMILASRLPKKDAVDRGREIVSDIAELFHLLLPVYNAVADQFDR